MMDYRSSAKNGGILVELCLKKSEALGQHPPIVILPKADKSAKMTVDSVVS